MRWRNANDADGDDGDAGDGNYFPPTPADSRGSASEKQLHAASADAASVEVSTQKQRCLASKRRREEESTQAARARSSK